MVSNPLDLPNRKDSVRICAKNGLGIEELLRSIEENLPVRLKHYNLLVPFDKASLLAVLRKAGALQSEEYTDKGIKADAIVEEALWHLVDEYAL